VKSLLKRSFEKAPQDQETECEKCGGMVRHTMGTQIVSAPGMLYLAYKPWDSPTELDSRFIRPSQTLKFGQYQPKAFREDEKLEALRLRYRVVGIVYHAGSSAQSGHYATAFKHPTKPKWFFCSDKRCQKISFRDIQKNKLPKWPHLGGALPYIFVYSLEQSKRKNTTTSKSAKAVRGTM
jgi:uncharacterized UBP type Zn finger protein